MEIKILCVKFEFWSVVELLSQLNLNLHYKLTNLASAEKANQCSQLLKELSDQNLHQFCWCILQFKMDTMEESHMLCVWQL